MTGIYYNDKNHGTKKRRVGLTTQLVLDHHARNGIMPIIDIGNLTSNMIVSKWDIIGVSSDVLSYLDGVDNMEAVFFVVLSRIA